MKIATFNIKIFDKRIGIRLAWKARVQFKRQIAKFNSAANDTHAR